MRFSTVASLALCGLVSAREMSIMERQVQTIVDQLNNINTLVGGLDTAIGGWTGGSPQPVIDASQKVIEATTSGTAAVNGASSISVNDAIQVQKVVGTLQTTVTKAVNDLVAKKDQASKAQLGGEAYRQLQKQYDGAKAISTAVSQKVPPSLATVATNLSANILAAIQKGIDAFDDIKGQVFPGQLTNTGTTASTGAAAGGAAAGGAAAGASGSGSNSTMAVASHAPTSASSPAATSAASAPAASTSAKSDATSFKVAGSFSVFAAVLAVFAL